MIDLFVPIPGTTKLGSGSVVDEYRAAFHRANLGEALAVRGEEAEGSRKVVDIWLRRIELVKA